MNSNQRSDEIVAVLRQALEALQSLSFPFGSDTSKEDDAIRALIQAIAVYESAPPECPTEAEKKAFAFGWWKAMEAQRAEKQTSVSEVEPVRGVYWKCVLCGFAHIEDECPECGHHTRAEFDFPHPQPKDEQIEKIYRAVDGNEFPIDFCREIEVAHGIHPSDFKEKNT